MSLVDDLTDQELSTLKGRTIIITGGASGIGHAAVVLAHSHGANVVIADITTKSGLALQDSLGSRALFHKTDVTSWDSILSLFDATVKQFGSIDTVCANAGTTQWDNLLEDSFDDAGKLQRPNMKLMDVNLRGHMYTLKAAVHYFGKQPQEGRKYQVVMTGSAASFLDTPPCHLYCASKAGVLGLMRSLRTQLSSQNITLNMVAPWMTVTPLLPSSIEAVWSVPRLLPVNEPHGVAKALLLPAIRQSTNGTSLFVAGNRIVEIEEKMHEAQRVWLGEKLSEDVDEGQRRLIPGREPALGSVEKERNGG